MHDPGFVLALGGTCALLVLLSVLSGLLLWAGEVHAERARRAAIGAGIASAVQAAAAVHHNSRMASVSRALRGLVPDSYRLHRAPAAFARPLEPTLPRPALPPTPPTWRGERVGKRGAR